MSEQVNGFDTVEVEVKGRKFTVKEASYGLLQELSAGLNHQDAEKKSLALKSFGANLIAATCSENGEAVTFEQAKAFPASIGKRLEKEALQINGMTEAAQAEAKNG